MALFEDLCLGSEDERLENRTRVFVLHMSKQRTTQTKLFVQERTFDGSAVKVCVTFVGFCVVTNIIALHVRIVSFCK